MSTPQDFDFLVAQRQPPYVPEHDSPAEAVGGLAGHVLRTVAAQYAQAGAVQALGHRAGAAADVEKGAGRSGSGPSTAAAAAAALGTPPRVVS
ncbi:hypothetical protein [Streptomyces xantholiticus]|uniref:hypothetical protein n=1 Tax=Streptomyces xantholiticus TaxID=68285 RepID=UPI003D9DF35D